MAVGVTSGYCFTVVGLQWLTVGGAIQFPMVSLTVQPSTVCTMVGTILTTTGTRHGMEWDTGTLHCPVASNSLLVLF